MSRDAAAPAVRGGLAFDLAPLLTSMTLLCVGSTYAKSLFPMTGAVGMVGLRNGLAALFLAVVFRPWRWRLHRHQWRLVVLYGAILGVMNLCYYLALARLPVGIALALEFLGPLSVALASSSRRLDLLWAGLAALGVAALVLPGSGGRALDPLGIAFILGAAAAWAAYILVGQRAAATMPNAQTVSLGLLVAAVLTVPPALMTAGSALWQPPVLARGAVVALLCSAIPYPLELIALRRLPRHVFGVLVSLEPAIGALAGLVLLGEHLSWLRWLAIGAVVAASAGVTLTRKAPTAPPVQP